MSMDDETSIAAKHREDDGDEAYYARQAAKAREAMRYANDCPRCGCSAEWTADDNSHHEVACSSGCNGRYAKGGTAKEAVERWNALPEDFECCGYGDCKNRVDDEDGICDACERRGENPGGCPGCGGSCQVACR